MKNVRLTAIIMAASLGLGTLASCASEVFDASREIGVISRENGSGTRSAFVELFGIEMKNEAGEKIDCTVQDAVVLNSTASVMTAVSDDAHAIGYVSMGALNDSVKAISVDGAEATVENIKNGSYAAARPFNIAIRDELSRTAQDFIDFIMSADGQAVIEDNGYIAVSDSEPYSGGADGKIVVGGSSSVTPVMEKLKEAYIALNPSAEIEIQQHDSSTGITGTIEGEYDIGMASRELKNSEVDAGLTSITIAMDGIAVIVSKDNPINELTSEQVCAIYTGELAIWEKITD